MTNHKISVLTNIRQDTSFQALPSIEEIISRGIVPVVELESDVLRSKLSSLMQDLFDVLTSVPQESNGFEVDNITFSVGIDTEGNVSLLSTVGGSVNTSSGLSFTIKRKKE